jgi:hypothetical protein
MAAKLGRPLRPDEDVDHLNEDKTDNSPSNLHVKTHGEHSKVTQSKGRKSLRALQRSLTMTKRREKLY